MVIKEHLNSLTTWNTVHSKVKWKYENQVNYNEFEVGGKQARISNNTNALYDSYRNRSIRK